LLGLAADYSFHFLAKFKATGDSILSRNLLLKGLVVSALSSIFAYLFLLFSPFPGLQQFSIFVASGLAAACITVLIIGPFFNKSSPNPVELGRVFNSFFEPLYIRIATNRGMILVVGLIVILSAIGNIYVRGVDDDVRQLNTSGDLLLEDEKKAQKLLGNFNKQRYFFIEGESQQQVLEKTELLQHELSNQQPLDRPKIQNYFYSTTTAIPSLYQQRLDYELIKRKIFSEQGAASILCKQLKSNCFWMEAQSKFNPNLLPSSLPNIISEIYPTVDLITANKNVVFFNQTNLKNSFSPSNILISGITYFDQVSNLTSILEGFRKQVTWLLVGFFLFMTAASFLLFGKKGLTIISAISFSSLVALSFSAGTGITVFHILALLLVIGIAVDTAVFFITPGLNRDTWAASTLACLTSAIAFGILSLSEIPLLHYFGSVVLLGLISAWLITPLTYFLLKEQ
jgi:predicted exporter